MPSGSMAKHSSNNQYTVPNIDCIRASVRLNHILPKRYLFEARTKTNISPAWKVISIRPGLNTPHSLLFTYSHAAILHFCVVLVDSFDYQCITHGKA